VASSAPVTKGKKNAAQGRKPREHTPKV